MKFGFNFLFFTTFFTDEHLPWLSLMKEIGYDGVEIPVGDGPVSHYVDLAPKIRDLGLEVTAVAMGMPEADPSSADPKVRQAGLDRLKSRIECTHELGGSILGGPIYAAHKHFPDERITDEDRKRAAATFAEAAPHAEAAGVTLCLEVLNRFEMALVNTTAHARQICATVDHPRVKIHYDTHHGHLEENSHAEAFAVAAPYLGHLHLSESHRGELGKGLVDWDAVKRGIADSGYGGWFTAEAFSTQCEVMRYAANVHRDVFTTREELARNALPFLRSLA
jgi:D-psicose/D-tagatose/L-ribulose 3-epimerase